MLFFFFFLCLFFFLYTDATRKFKAIQAWWQDMAERNYKSVGKPAAPSLQQSAKNETHVPTSDLVNAAVVIQKHLRGWLARSKYVKGVSKIDVTLNLCQEKDVHDLPTNEDIFQIACKNSILHNSLQNKEFSAVKIQSNFRCWLLRRRFQNQRAGILRIQSDFRMSRCWKAYKKYKIANASATLIQSFVRRWITQREACRQKHQIVVIQVSNYLL